MQERLTKQQRLDALSLEGVMMTDPVNNPPHYTQGSVECIAAIESALTPEEFRGYLKGNIIKYMWRERNKGGKESLAKALWYLNRLLNQKESRPSSDSAERDI